MPTGSPPGLKPAISVVVAGGQIVEQGTVNLPAFEGEYARLHAMQFSGKNDRIAAAGGIE